MPNFAQPFQTAASSTGDIHAIAGMSSAAGVSRAGMYTGNGRPGIIMLVPATSGPAFAES